MAEAEPVYGYFVDEADEVTDSALAG